MLWKGKAKSAMKESRWRDQIMYFLENREILSVLISIYLVKTGSGKEKKTPHKVIEQGFRSNQISSPMEASEGLDVLNLLIMNFP